MANYIYAVPMEELTGHTPDGNPYGVAGKARILTTAEAVIWVKFQVDRAARKRGGKGRYIDDKNIKSCIEYVEGYRKGSGGGTGYTYKGHQVIHISHGKKNSDDGCVLFFCLPADNLASIILIGSHAGGSDHTYAIDWVKDGWHDRRLCPTITSK